MVKHEDKSSSWCYSMCYEHFQWQLTRAPTHSPFSTILFTLDCIKSVRLARCFIFVIFKLLLHSPGFIGCQTLWLTTHWFGKLLVIFFLQEYDELHEFMLTWGKHMEKDDCPNECWHSLLSLKSTFMIVCTWGPQCCHSIKCCVLCWVLWSINPLVVLMPNFVHWFLLKIWWWLTDSLLKWIQWVWNICILPCRLIYKTLSNNNYLLCFHVDHTCV